ncbi:MAG: acetyl-CoA decarbonylase/synthase complex subunit gamma [Proteobacteria bacterium]|nr:acetyl-CoA decarbonylase/synthase complex subunit gamma [Pseudomonadota bacterium]
MALKGAEIMKRLPKTNCKECGYATCFAFAMKLATGGAKLEDCPYLAPEVKVELEAAMAPPIKRVTIGVGETALVIGEEEVMFRHEKTFFHEPGIAILISDKENDSDIEKKIKDIKELHFERIGKELKINLLALSFESGDKTKFETLVKKAYETTDFALILICNNIDVLLSAAALCADRKPLVYPITKENIDLAIPKLKELRTPAGVKGESIEEIVSLTSTLKEAGVEEIVLDPGSKNLKEGIRDQTFIRRAALKKGFRPLGYPTITFPCFMYQDKFKEALAAAAFITKYAGIIVISQVDKHFLFPLLVQRFNIYTDPRRPMTVEEKVYEISKPNEYSPILISTNYALDFFIVSGAIEEANIPAYLCIKDTGGIGVMAAWTSGKFNGEAIADFFKKYGIENKVKHRKLIIPGVAKKLKDELEEELPDWEIIFGPLEGSDIPKFLSEGWKE